MQYMKQTFIGRVMKLFQQQVIKEDPGNETIGFLCVKLVADPGFPRRRGAVPTPLPSFELKLNITARKRSLELQFSGSEARVGEGSLSGGLCPEVVSVKSVHVRVTCSVADP